MTDPKQHSLDDDLIDRSLLRLNTVATATGLGLLFGIVLFITTLFLAIRDGASAGPHLSLLGQYFPGYSVTVLGSFIGFAYAFATAFIATELFVRVYDYVSRKRQGTAPN